ncbi:MAG: aminotransferase class III-fold pyridoxal phosphate-dependent enzyme, partial [Chlorobiales bacterium]|nr:aminotransferase class III-fold pyridoxal phosphate-dependent enzyme [Chlorobiales bacterium]
KRAAELGKLFLEQLQGIVGGDVVLAVRGKGLMFGIDLAGPEVAAEIQDRLIEKGFIVCNRGALFRIDPPLIIEPDIFQAFIDAFTEAVHTIGRRSP